MALETLITALAAWKWPVTIVAGLLIFKKDISKAVGRLRRGKISNFEFDLDQLEVKAASADAEARALPPTEGPKALPQPSEPPGPEFLQQASNSPKSALMSLSAEIETELRNLLAVTGWHRMRRVTSVPAGVEMLAAETPLPPALKGSIRDFWPVRNRLVHGHDVSEDDLLRAIDSGLLILRALRSIPREVHAVYHPGVRLFADPAGRRLVPDARAVILETTLSDGSGKRLRPYPTTRTNYIKGKPVAWEWSNRHQWGECWYEQPDTGTVEYAWSSSLEFIGRHLDEMT